MRHLPQVDLCATLHGLFPYKGATLAETFAHLPPDRAEHVLTTRGLSLSEDFRALSESQKEVALDVLRRYRKRLLAGNL